MNWFNLVCLLGAVLLVSFAGAVLIRRYAMISGMIDVPGRRSSHSVPTPRGGGLPGAAAWLAAVGAVHFLGLLEVRWALALISGGFICLAAGWLEDRFGLPAIIRFALHIVAGVAVLYWGGGLGRLKIGGGVLPLGVFGWVVGILWVVWFVNLFNFMDGIDGIAGQEAVCGGLALGLMFFWSGQTAMACCCWALAAAALGFLLVNWPPAKIFMGDVGSYTFGFALAALALIGAITGAVPAVCSLIVLMVFFFDATVTILRRLFNREAIYKAHRSHFYQRAVISGLSHSQVDVAVLVLNAVLMLTALAAYHLPDREILSLIFSLVLLSATAVAVTALERRAARIQGKGA